MYQGELQEQEDGPGLTTGTMSTAARQKSSRERIASTGEEFSPQEKSIVDQIEKFLSGLASAEGVDLMRHKPFLNRIIQILDKQIKPKMKQGDQE